MKYVLTNLSLYVSIDIICSKKHLAFARKYYVFCGKFFYFSQQFAGFAINLKHEVTWWNKVNEKLTGVSEKDVLHTDNYWKIFYHTQKVLPVDLLLMEDTDREKEFPSLNFFGDICYGFFKN